MEIQPRDSHNERLLSNTHPADWKNPEPAPMYNMVAIGAGTAGLVTAAGTAGLGGRVALIESDLMGGDCLNVGCVPSKAVIRSSRVAADIIKASDFGIGVDQLRPDFPAVMERVRKIRAQISDHDSFKRFSELGIDVFMGRGKFTGPDSIEVDGTELKFKKAAICTGARAAVPDVPGLKEAGILTNENVFNLTELPARLAVYGGGPIGAELAQAFSRLGSKVTMIVRSRLSSKDDPEASDILLEQFRSEGIDVLLGTALKSVSVSDGEKVLTISDGDGVRELKADSILVAVGRAPNVEGIGLEEAGVEYDSKRGVIVDDMLRTSNRRVFAAGDVCMTQKFTHAADFAARIVIQNALFGGRKKLSGVTIPRCTYSDPEIAQVGLNEKEAEAAGVAVDVYKVGFDDVDRAVADGEENGFVKILTAKGKDQILGATIVAKHSGDMISEISVAMAAGMGLGGLAAVVHPYPTQAEAIRKAGDAYNRTRLKPWLKNLFGRWMAWSR